MNWNDVAWDRIDAAVDGLENAWHTESEVDLASFLPTREDPQYCEVLATLIKIDLEHRWDTGQPTRLEDYIQQWPEVLEDQDVLAELVSAECRIRLDHDQTPTAEEISSRFPGLVEIIDIEAICAETESQSNNEISQLLSSIVEHGIRPNSAGGTTVDLVGKVVKHYEIEGLLGRGGMGIVYLARDTKLGRKAALKILNESARLGSGETDLLMHDARASAGLSHPGIVKVYEVGETEDGQPFLAMEHVSGPSLADEISQNHITTKEAVTIAVQIAEALQLAHQNGIIHRDIKPANILMDDEHGARLTDFGLAYREDSPEVLSGAMAGTLPYMAPEQFSDQAGSPDGRTDIWSLGVVLYEMLSRERPFRGENYRELREAILHHEPKPLRQRDKEIPAALSAICAKCLAKVPSERYQAAADLAADLKQWVHRQDSRRGPMTTVSISLVVTIATALALVVALVGYNSTGILEFLAAPSATVAEHAGPLDGVVDVVVFNRSDPARQHLSIRDPAARPLRNDDLIRVEVELSEPAYAYILWIDQDGVVAPVYPWTPGKWDSPRNESPVKQISLPDDSALDQPTGWPLDGEPGMQTVILLLRRDPLPENIDLAKLLNDLPEQRLQDPRSLVWFKNGSPVMKQVDRTRAPQFFNATAIDDPVYQTQHMIHTKLAPYFELISASAFAYEANDEP